MNNLHLIEEGEYLLHHKAYRVYEDTEELVYDAYLTSQGAIKTTIYEANDVTETTSTFDSQNRLIKEIEMLNGTEASRIELTYNEDMIVRKVMFIGGDIFEDRIFGIQEDVHIEVVNRDGEEIERIKTRHYDWGTQKEFYNQDGLFETQESRIEGDWESVKFFDAAGNLFLKERNQYLDDKIITTESLLPNEEVLYRKEAKTNGSDIVYEEVYDFESNVFYKSSFEYDSHGLIVKSQKKSMNDKVLEWRMYSYDENGFLIAEKGYSTGEFDAIYGTSIMGENYHIKHEYEILELNHE